MGSFKGNGRGRDPERRGARGRQKRATPRLESLEHRMLLAGPPSWQPTSTNPADLKNGPLANTGRELVQVYQEFKAFLATNRTVDQFQPTNKQLMVKGGMINVDVRVYGNVNTAADLLGAANIGMIVKAKSAQNGIVEGYVPIDKLLAVASLKQVLGGKVNVQTIGVDPVAKPEVRSVGAANNQAEDVFGLPAALQQFPGLNGSGITVGVLSDSVSRFQGGLQDSINTGDLPPLSRISVLLDEPVGGSNADEGRAMMELIYDLAPGVNFAYNTAFIGQAAFADGIRALSGAGAQVIVDDIGYRDEPFYQPGPIEQAISDVVRNANRIYLSAAGNSADKGFESPFRGAQATIAGNSGTFMDFDPGAGVLTQIPITVNAGGQIVFQYDQPFFTSNGVTSDIDVFVLDGNGNIVAQGNANNIASQIPEEVVDVPNAGTFSLAIYVRTGTAPGRVQLVSWGGDVDFSKQFGGQGGISYPTTFGHSAGADAIGVGAVPFFNAPPFGNQSPLQNEDFSSFGPRYLVFDAAGNRLGGAQLVQQPVISGVDNTNTTFFIPGNDIPQDADAFPNFSGTSAAAPNLAALAALMRQISPGVSQADVLNAFKQSATPLNGAAKGTWDPQGGFGLPVASQAFQAVDRLRVQAVSSGNGMVRTALPNELSFVFNKGVDTSSVQAGDLQFTQLPPGVTVTPFVKYAAGNIVVFGLNITRSAGTKANGTFAYQLNDSAMRSADGKTLVGFGSTFVVSDASAPRVTSTTFSGRTILVEFSEPVDPSTINASNLKLQRAGGDGTFGNPSDVTVTSLPGTFIAYFDQLGTRRNVALIDLVGIPQQQLPSDTYRLVIEDNVIDQVGNRLDGEFNGVFSSGNGSEGGDFVQNLGIRTLQAPQVVSLSLAPSSDTGLQGDQNTRDIQPTFVGQVAATFPGTRVGLKVYVQFNSLHGGVFDLTRGVGGRGINPGANVDVTTTTDSEGRFTFRAPSWLPNGFHTVRIVVEGAPDAPPLPGLSTQFDMSFRVDTSSPFFEPMNVAQDAKISSLTGGISLLALDPVIPSNLGNPLGVPLQFQVPALNPSSATNISNYSLINLGKDRQLGGGDDTDFSNFINGAVYTELTNRGKTNDWYVGKVDLSFAEGLPAGRYMLVARAPGSGFPGITDAAGNALDASSGMAGAQNFSLNFDFQPTPTFVTDVMTVSPDTAGFSAINYPRSYFEVQQPGKAPRAPAAPVAFVLDFSAPLNESDDYTDKVWLVRSADTPTSTPDGDFGTDSTMSSGVGFTRIAGITVKLVNAIEGAVFGSPGFKNRLVITLAPGTSLPPDNYRLYVPNQILPDGRDLRINDTFGNQIDGEFLGNPTATGGWETLLPTGQYRSGYSGDLVPGGSFETGYVVVANGNVIFAKPDYIDDPAQTSDDPDGSLAKPYTSLGAEALPTGANGGDLNSGVNFGSFNPNLDLNGNGRFDRSALFAASQRSGLGPVVVVALPSAAEDPLNRTFVLQRPSQNPGQPTIPDGSASVPFNTTLVFQPGSILKMRNASLYVQNQGSAIQLRGGPNPNDRVTITSYNDDSVGGDTNRDGLPTSQGGTGANPFPGDFGGIVLRNFNDTSNGGRPIPVTPGPDDPTRPQVDNRPKLGISGADDALSSFNFANLRYGGGTVPQTIGFRFDAITLFNSRPSITNVTIDGFQSSDGANGPNGGSQGGISGDMDSFREDELARGPLVRRSTVQRTSLNGIYVRAELNGNIQQTNAIIYPDNPSSRGGQQNYTFDDPLPYILTARMVVGQRLQHNSGLDEVDTTPRVYVQPGMMFKFQRGAAIDLTNVGASINLGDRTYINEFDAKPNLAPSDADFVPQDTGDARIVFTSFFDDTSSTEFVDPNTGVRTTIVAPIDSDNGSSNLPTPGNVPDLARWGSLNVLSGAVAVVDEVDFKYGGGSVNLPNAVVPQRDVLNFSGAAGFTAFGQSFGALGTRAYVTNNNFFDNKEAAIGIEADGLFAADPLRPLLSGNPFFRGNVMQRNDVNGMEVFGTPVSNRNGTSWFGYPANLAVDSVWDDTDLTYVLRTTIVLAGATSLADIPYLPPATYTTELRPFISLTIQSGLPDTLLASGDRIAKPGEPALVKLLNDFSVPPIGDGVNGMPASNIFTDSRGGAGFLVGMDDGVDGDPDGNLIDPGMMSQIRFLGIGGNESTGQPRVPVIVTSLRDNTVGRTVRGVTMNASASAGYLAAQQGLPGGPTAGPQAGDGGVIGFGGNTLGDYNLMDPRDGNLIDNADIRYMTRIEMQGGGWVYSPNGADGGTIFDKTGAFRADTQFNSARAMTISNSNLSSFSQVGVIAHPSGVGQIEILTNPPPGTPIIARDGRRGQPVLLYMYNNTIANMPTGVRINSETVNNDQHPSPYVGILQNNTFYNNAVGVHTQGAVFNAQNSLSHVFLLGMDNIFANSSDVAVRVVEQATGSQLMYNLFSGNNNNVQEQGQTFTGYAFNPGDIALFNAQPIFGNAAFTNPAAGDFSLTGLSDAIDAGLSEIVRSNWGNLLRPIADQRLDASGGVRNQTGRNIATGGLGDVSEDGDIVTLPGLSPGLRGYIDQWVPAIPGSAGAIPGPVSNAGGTFSYKPIEGERDANGFLRQDAPSRANVGFGSRPFFDIGAREFRQLFPPHVTGVVATVPDAGAPGGVRTTNIYAVTTAGGNFAGVNKNPNTIQIKLDQRIDPATITSSTILLQASGGDGIFGNANNSQDRFIPLSGKLSYDATTSTITIGLSALGLTLTSDLYRIVIRGSGDPVIRNEQGLPLDGENTVGGSVNGAQLPLPSGNGTPGGDFFVTFSVDTNPPRIDPSVDVTLAAQAAPDPRPNDSITSDSTPSFSGRILDVPPPTNPLQGQIVVVDIDLNGDGNYEILNAGNTLTDAQGNFTVTVGQALADSPNYSVGPDGIAGTSDDTGFSVARIRVVDQSGNQSNLNDTNALVRFVVDTRGPRVTGTDPLPGVQATVGSNGTIQFSIAVNENIEPSTLNVNSIRVAGSGGDGIFGNGNDTTLSIVPGSIRQDYLKTPTGSSIIRFSVSGITTNDLYRVTLVGNANGLLDIAGNPLDGEYTGTLPSGNGTPGGDFNLDFIVINPAFSRTVFVSKGSTGGSPTGSRSNPYPTIAAGLAAARIGDTVAVIGGSSSGSPVVYNESVTMKSLVKLVSADPTSTDSNVVPGVALKTIIRPDAGTGATTTITANDLVSVPSFLTEVRGFLIAASLTGNTSTGAIVDGSRGVSIVNSDILIDRNYIIDTNHGVVVTLSGGARGPQVQNNGIIGNINGLVIGVNGAITSFQNGHNVQVYNNTFAFNTAGSVVLANAGSPVVGDYANNLFWQNADRTTARNGTAIFSSNAGKLRVRNNLFSSNGPSTGSPADDTVNVGGGFDPALLTTTPDVNGNLTGNAVFVSPIDPRPNANGPANFYLGANYDLAGGATGAIDNALGSVAPSTDFRFRNRVDIANRGFAGPADIGAFEFNGTGGIGSGSPIGGSSTTPGGTGSLAALASYRSPGDPPLGSGVAAASASPDRVTVTFSAPVDKGSVDATDLLLSGDGLDPSAPAHATSLSWVDDRTVQFTLSGEFRSTGTVQLDIPQGAIRNADSTLVPEFSQTVSAPADPAPTSTPASPPSAPVAVATTSPGSSSAVTVTVPTQTANPTPAATPKTRQAAARAARLAAQAARTPRAGSGNFLSRLSRFGKRPNQA